MCQPSAVGRTGPLSGDWRKRRDSNPRRPALFRQLIVDLRSPIKVVRERNLAASNQRAGSYQAPIALFQTARIVYFKMQCESDFGVAYSI